MRPVVIKINEAIVSHPIVPDIKAQSYMVAKPGHKNPQKLKKVMESQTGGSKFNIIPIKNDLTHVIKVHNVLKNNELVAIHADRYLEGAKFLELDFLDLQNQMLF